MKKIFKQLLKKLYDKFKKNWRISKSFQEDNCERVHSHRATCGDHKRPLLAVEK